VEGVFSNFDNLIDQIGLDLNNQMTLDESLAINIYTFADNED